jgi:hypothetical protein
MFNPVKFCFKHDRIRVHTGDYLQLERDSFWKLAGAKVHVQDLPCDRCEAAEAKKREEQGRLFQ